MKHIFLFSIILFVFACKAPKEKKMITFNGKTQGTTYSIKVYTFEDSIKLQQGIDSILTVINQTASLWDSTSIISKVNNNQDVALNQDFINLFNRSVEISIATHGCFDITVGELVKSWGFSFKQKQELSPKQVDSILKYVGYQNLSLANNKLIKKYSETNIDFNAIAQGYTVDRVAAYFLKNNDTDFIVEIGGEIMVRGTKANKEKWIVGIDKPTETESGDNGLQEKLSLLNKAISTSGSYRKFFIKDGIKYSHTIDPRTGYPVHHSLLSVSVIANDCTSADAYATAFMVMGLEKAKEFLKMHPGIEAYFIYSDSISKNQVYFTNNFFKQGE